jgi:hypothetical protein
MSGELQASLEKIIVHLESRTDCGVLSESIRQVRDGFAWPHPELITPVMFARMQKTFVEVLNLMLDMLKRGEESTQGMLDSLRGGLEREIAAQEAAKR